MRQTWKTLLILGTLIQLTSACCLRHADRAQPPSIPVTLKPSAEKVAPKKDFSVTKDKDGTIILGPDVNLFCDEDVQGIVFDPIPCEPRDCDFVHPEYCQNVL